MRRHLIIAGVIWVVLTGIFWAGIPPVERFYPPMGAHEAEAVDSAFRLLLIFAAPVYAFVVAAVVYSVLAFRSRGQPLEDGPPLRGRGLIGPVWLAITSALAIVLIIDPGLVGLNALRAHGESDMVVQVEGRQWLWRITYPEYGITTFNDLVVPADRRIKFEITSTDVVHSFWVPAWRGKIDAVPGLVTTIYVTPTVLGDSTGDHHLRLQCAEMCGLSHAAMVARVTVTDQAGFDTWVAEMQAKQR